MNNSLTGLTSAQVAELIALGQTNKVTQRSSRSIGAILRANLFTLFNAVVGGAFILMLSLGQIKDALFGVVVILNIAVGVVQEFRTKLTLDRLSLLSVSPARVMRDGQQLEIPPSQIVLGDILVLRAGDSIAADAKVLETHGLQVDESMLTGESVEVQKALDDALMAGTAIMAGTGFAVVTGVGEATTAAQIAADARRFSLVASELRESLNKVIRWISWILLPVVLLSAFGQLQALGGWQVALSSGTWPKAVVGAVASLISLVPQGLVLLTSLALSLGAIRLANKNVLAQELAAVEGLARVDVVCFDKTGTLTDGNIAFERVTQLVQNRTDAAAAQIDHALATFAQDPNANATASALAAQFTAGALVTARTIAFSSERKWSGFETADSSWVLGAPEFVLPAFDPALVQAAEFAAQGERILVLAHSPNKFKDETLPTKLQAVALLHFSEQLRSDTIDTLRFFAEQGVNVYVISGDNPATVAHTAARAGIVDIGEPIDASLYRDDVDALVAAIDRGRIIGRVHPHQKQQLVAAMQARGHVVAMIGDGVNDCLALKQSDLGIAMGSGAAATKSVANLVFLDGKFATIPLVLAEGRRVVANVERVSRLFLTKTVWAFVISLGFGALLWDFPFLPRQLTAMDSFAIGIPAFLLALLPNAALHRPGFLGRALRFVIPSGLAIGVGVITLTALIRGDASWSAEQAHTGTIVLLSMASLWVLALHSTPMTASRSGILTAMVALCVLLFCVPTIGGFFGFVALPIGKLALVSACAVGVNALISVGQRLLNSPQGKSA